MRTLVARGSLKATNLNQTVTNKFLKARNGDLGAVGVFQSVVALDFNGHSEYQVWMKWLEGL